MLLGYQIRGWGGAGGAAAEEADEGGGRSNGSNQRTTHKGSGKKVNFVQTPKK